jgi:hypothetical protein
MSLCPSYYRVPDGREFYQWYAETVTPLVRNDLDHDKAHALASACEYIYRAGRKTPSPVEDFRKASRLIERIMELCDETDDEDGITETISLAIGRVVQLKMAAEIAEKPKTVDLTDPIVTAWGAITR